MADGISKIAEQGVPAPIPDCYQGFSMNDKSRILDEFIDVAGATASTETGCWGTGRWGTGRRRGQWRGLQDRRVNDEAVREIVILIWEDRTASAATARKRPCPT